MIFDIHNNCPVKAPDPDTKSVTDVIMGIFAGRYPAIHIGEDRLKIVYNAFSDSNPANGVAQLVDSLSEVFGVSVQTDESLVVLGQGPNIIVAGSIKTLAQNLG